MLEPVALPAGNVLALVCAYRGGVRAPDRAGAFVPRYRDFYANPRAPAYQKSMVEALLAGRPDVTIRVDAALADIWPGHAAAPTADISGADLAGHDAILLCYADPLGLSFGALEARLMRAGAPIFVFNGRGRLFALDPAMRRALIWRRFLAETRVVEAACGVLALPTALTLSALDAARGRS